MKKKLISVLLIAVLSCTISACGGGTAQNIGDVAVEENIIQTETTFGNIYIGMLGKTMTEYPCQNSNRMTPEMFISTIAGMTGWNLDLADAVAENENGGLTVCFAESSSLFTGLPENQTEEFAAASEEELITTILDSIQFTLKNNYEKEYEIYYCMEGGEALELSLIGKTIPADQPYNGLDESVNASETKVVALEE